MLEGLEPLKQLFNPRVGLAAKPSKVTLKPIEAWEYLVSLVKQYYDPTAPPGKPSPAEALRTHSKSVQ